MKIAVVLFMAFFAAMHDHPSRKEEQKIVFLFLAVQFQN